MSAVTEAAGLLTRRVGRIEVVIHHLLGHSPEQITDLVRATETGLCRLWLHDFFTLCPNYVLQRNGVSFCGAPPASSNACRLCIHGAERITHLDRMVTFSDAIDVHVLAPSQFAADFWAALVGRDLLVLDPRGACVGRLCPDQFRQRQRGRHRARLGRGAVLADEGDLDAFFRDGRALAMAAELRARRRTERAGLSRSDMSLELLQEGSR